MKETLEGKRRRVISLIRTLKKVYPKVRCGLQFSSPWELLVGTILSAQCTDKRVNQVTPSLFEKFPTVQAFADADPRGLEKTIRSTGFYRNKAKHLLATAQQILKRFDGQVPSHMEDLVLLPGVGRKTANVVLGHAFGIASLSVDTHMIRINRRLKLTRNENPVKIESDLMALVPKKDWVLYSDLIITHGRRCCFARHPDCAHCPVFHLCPFGKKRIALDDAER